VTTVCIKLISSIIIIIQCYIHRLHTFFSIMIFTFSYINFVVISKNLFLKVRFDSGLKNFEAYKFRVNDDSLRIKCCVIGT